MDFNNQSTMSAYRSTGTHYFFDDTNTSTSTYNDYLFFFVFYFLVCNLKITTLVFFRDYNLGENAAWDAASEKVERRTPYMKEWGDGKSVANTSEEAEELWQAVKRKEKKQQLLECGEQQQQQQHKKHLINNGFVRFIQALGIHWSRQSNNGVTSAGFGFAAGALVMAILQKIRSR
jgi:hypothetical protein